jgi:hypothetical protein
MASRACFIDSTLKPSGTLKSPQKAIRMVHRWYKVPCQDQRFPLVRLRSVTKGSGVAPPCCSLKMPGKPIPDDQAAQSWSFSSEYIRIP